MPIPDAPGVPQRDSEQVGFKKKTLINKRTLSKGEEDAEGEEEEEEGEGEEEEEEVTLI